MIVLCICSALLGVITTSLGYGSFRLKGNKLNLNPIGVLINVVGVIIIVFISRFYNLP